jgi:ABC-type glycerol-3-phosphate transport system substrate-binding protein
MKKYLLGLVLIGILVAGCSVTPATDSGTTPEPSPLPTATLLPTLTGTQPASGQTVLRLWVPPQFDPANETQAGDVLQNRLEQYTAQRPDVRIETRVKESSGTGGLLDSLSTANAAAPLAVPDLILLPRASLEIAALKGLLFPIDELTDNINGGDWYPFAQGLAQLQTSTFGLPFAGDALVSLYRPAEIEVPPADWSATLELAQPLSFPAAEDQAYFTLAEYLSTGAQIQDSEGRPALDTSSLTDLLSFYQDAEAAGVMPFWLTQFTTDEQSWESYSENQVNLVITWTNRYLSALPGDTSAAPIFTQSGTPVTLANGWVWALSNPQSERHALSVDLAEYLTQGDFLAEWTETAGYLPPRESALTGWSNIALQGLIEQIVRSAQVIPPNDVIAVVGPALQEATLNVLKQQSDPVSAANQAVQSLETP